MRLAGFRKNMLYEANIYVAFTENALKQKYAYRFKSIMWSMSMIFNMLVQYYLWRSIYAETNGTFLGISEDAYITYIAVGVIFYNLTNCMENMNISEEIKSGNIAMNLLKPYHYKLMVFSRHLGSKIGDLIAMIPIAILSFLLIENLNINILTLILFLLSSILAFIVAFLFSYIVGLIAFWTTNYWGVQFLVSSISGILSGQLMALDFYLNMGKSNAYTGMYDFLNSSFVVSLFHGVGILAYCMPFQSMFYTPMSIFSGIIYSTQSIVVHIMIQLLWVILLNFLSGFIWRTAQKKITIYGG